VRTQARVHGYADPNGWASRGACQHADPDLFFPVASAGPSVTQTVRAKEVCAQCPVRRPCLQFALESGQDFGVWGGASEDERRTMRRRQLRHARRGQRDPASPAMLRKGA
jgi:WhiB family transcriptional regulator, redox-sensing transcriptional regulator